MISSKLYFHFCMISFTYLKNKFKSLRYISTKSSEKSRDTYDILTDKITLILSPKSVVMFSVLFS